jgi:signal transduction histidine kinase
VVGSRRAEADFRTVRIRPSISVAVAAGHQPLAERLVVNLVDNALRHNIPQGEVEVSTGTVDGHAVLTVANTGPVVPPDAVDRLFQPFQRLRTTRTGSRTEGLGLGLSIVQAIAIAHDATIAATARPEGGLTINVTFPAVNNHPPVTRRRPEQTATARTR